MSPQEFYQTFREQQQALLRVTSRTRNWITVLKLLCFAALVFCLYRLIATYGAAARIIELKTLIRCCDTESDYLNGKTAELDTGVKFLDPGHPTLSTWTYSVKSRCFRRSTAPLPRKAPNA